MGVRYVIIMAARHAAMLAAGHSALPLSFFFAVNLRGRLADRHQTLPQCSMVTQIYKIPSEIWVPLPTRNLAAQNIKISTRFRTTSRLDREYISFIGPIYRTQQDIVNRKTSSQTTNTHAYNIGKLKSEYFGLQTAKIGSEF